MPDILAGARIKALDFTASQSATDNSDVLNVGTTPTAGSPQVGTTFVAPTSGKAMVTVGGSTRDDGGNNVGILEPQIFEGTSATGSAVLDVPNTQYRVQLRGASANSLQFASRTRLVTGLTPGTTYYARVMVSAGGGTTVDFTRRSIDVQPVT